MKNPAMLITDIDNTLYDFPAYYEAGLRAAIEEILNTFDADIDTVIAWLRDIYARHGSIEYPFAIEELPPARNFGLDRRHQFVQRTLRAFWTAATAQLELYPTVQFALRELHRQGVPVIAYTDAPIHEATRRLSQLGVSRYLTGIVARAWFRKRPMATFVLCLQDLPGFSRPSRRLEIVWRIPSSERKPSVAVYQRISNAFDMRPSKVTVVGDSIPRDLVPAMDAGMNAVWARYGIRDIERETLLRRVVPNRLPELQSRNNCSVPPTTIDLFEHVVQQLPVQQILDIHSLEY